MKLYHGSYLAVPHPDLKHSRQNVDFGPGFYTTPIYQQALKWCQRIKRHGQRGIISCYTMENKVFPTLNIKKFDGYSEEWLDFVLKCRTSKDTTDYDIVIGGVADDNVFNTVELYFDGLIDKKEALKRLRYEKPNLQDCFRTAQALKHLHFLRSEQV